MSAPVAVTPKLVLAVAAVVPPVPPLAKPNVPASVTAPVVVVLGVSPVVPALNDNTPVLAMVTLPVAPDTLTPVPAMLDSTPVLATVIAPGALVMPMPDAGVKVLSTYPLDTSPINSCPSEGSVPKPVPPRTIGKVPLTI